MNVKRWQRNWWPTQGKQHSSVQFDSAEISDLAYVFFQGKGRHVGEVDVVNREGPAHDWQWCVSSKSRKEMVWRAIGMLIFFLFLFGYLRHSAVVK